MQPYKIVAIIITITKHIHIYIIYIKLFTHVVVISASLRLDKLLEHGWTLHRRLRPEGTCTFTFCVLFLNFQFYLQTKAKRKTNKKNLKTEQKKIPL